MTAEAAQIVEAYRATHAEVEERMEQLDTPSRWYFDKDGSPLTTFEFVALFADDHYRRVALDDIPPHGHISTVWLGSNHNWGEGPPLIFETMVFLREAQSSIQARYATLEDAQRGHAFYLEEARRNILRAL